MLGIIFDNERLQNASLPQLLKLHGGVFDELNVSSLDKGFDQFLAQTDQLVSVSDGKAEPLGDRADHLALDVEEVDVGRECAEQVEDVVAPVVAYNTLALD